MTLLVRNFSIAAMISVSFCFFCEKRVFLTVLIVDKKKLSVHLSFGVATPDPRSLHTSILDWCVAYVRLVDSFRILGWRWKARSTLVEHMHIFLQARFFLILRLTFGRHSLCKKNVESFSFASSLRRMAFGGRRMAFGGRRSAVVGGRRSALNNQNNTKNAFVKVDT